MPPGQLVSQHLPYMTTVDMLTETPQAGARTSRGRRGSTLGDEIFHILGRCSIISGGVRATGDLVDVPL